MGIRIALLLALIAAPAAGDTVTLSPDRDVTLFENPQGSLASGSGDLLFVGRNNQGLIRRAVLRFDVAGTLPPGATITGVELRMLMDQTSDPSFRILRLHRAAASWGEGSSVSGGGQGAPADTGDATWIHRVFPDQSWDVPGGDFTTPARDSIQVAAMGIYSWTGPALVADVQSWLDAPATNHGWFLVGEETVNQTARRFLSREAALEADRPALIVTFSPVSTRTLSWGRLKARVPPHP